MGRIHPEGKKARSERSDEEPLPEKVKVDQRRRRPGLDNDQQTKTDEAKQKPSPDERVGSLADLVKKKKQ